MLPHYVSRYLVRAPEPDDAPEGFTRVEQPLRSGLPHTIDLSPTLRVLLIVPTGMATYWRDADARELVSSGALEYAAHNGHTDFLHRVPATLLVQLNTRTIAAGTLHAGVMQRFAESGLSAVRLELVVLDWTIRAGTLRGPGDFGSSLSIGWRLADVAADEFSEAPRNPVFVERKPDKNMKSKRKGRFHLHAYAYSAQYISKVAVLGLEKSASLKQVKL